MSRLSTIMAAKRFGLGGQIIPFWKREIEPLPKWQKGDPQIRIFLPTFWMKMIKPPKDTPNTQAHFITHPQMTRFDIKNYLEKVYNVPVAHVRTEVKRTSNKPPGLTIYEELRLQDVHYPDSIRDKKRVNIRYAEEYKRAIVELGAGETFEFPDIESKLPSSTANEDQEEMLEKRDKEKRDNWTVNHVPSWFR